MKNLLFVGLLLLSASAFTQSTFGVKAGTVYSYASEISFGNSFGYYGGFTYEEVFKDELGGLTAEVLYLNQITRYSGVGFSHQSVNVVFGPNFYFVKDFPLNLLVAVQSGHDTVFKVDGDKVDVDKKIRTSAIAGLNYAFNKIQIQYRYAYEIRGSSSFQLGINYRFKSL